MAAKHDLEKLFALSAVEILTVVQRNNRLLMAVKGGVAQEHLSRYLTSLVREKRIVKFGPIDEDGKPDFWVIYNDRKFLLECKNIQKTLRKGEMTVDFMRTRYAKTVGPEGRFYKSTEFHILAACLFNQTGQWKFKFIPTRRLGKNSNYKGRLDNKVSLGESKNYFKYWRTDLLEALQLVGQGG
jgi:hypothetical protein